MQTTCTCNPAYRETGFTPEDPCGHGDTSEGCPVHDPNVAAVLLEANALDLDVEQFDTIDDLITYLDERDADMEAL